MTRLLATAAAPQLGPWESRWRRLSCRCRENGAAGKEAALRLGALDDPLTWLLEISKFLGTVALIVVTGLLLLLAG